MPLQRGLFSIELWSKAAERLAVLNGIVPGCRIAQSRNEADEIDWNVPLELLDAYARRIFTKSSNLLVVRSTEVRIKYGGILLASGEVVDAPVNINQDGLMLNIKAEGFLNFWADRYLEDDKTYTDENAPDIAKDLMVISQSNGDDWDYGVTFDTMPTIDTHTITYKSGTNIKDALQNLTRRIKAPFDLEFAPDKVFKAYPAIGSVRPEVIFSYPGNILPGSSIAYFGTELANRILVYGSGISAEAAPPTIRDDTASQGTYKVRQAKITPNDVSETDTLENYGDDELAARADPVKLPTLKVDGNARPFITDYGIGDYVKVKLAGSDFIAQAVMMRVERREIEVDENGVITVTNYVS